MPLKQQAVLFRAAHHSDLLEVELARRNIPFVKYGGLKFLEAAHVKDALSFLRILENPFDEVSWFRVLQLPEGVGPATARRSDGRARRPPDRRRPAVAAAPVPGGAGRPCPRPPVTACRSSAPRSAIASVDESVMPPAAQLDRLRAFLEPVFARRYDAAASRVARPRAAGAARERLRVARAVRGRADAGSAVVHRRPRGTAAPGRGLARALDDPFGQGPGVGRGPRDPRGRRHDPVGHGHRRRRARSKRNAGCSTSP